MREIGEDAEDALKGDRLIMAGAAHFDIGPGYRLWSGHGLLQFLGQVWKPVGARALLTAVGGAAGGSAEGVSLELSGLEPDVAATIENEDYHQKAVVIYRLVFSADGATLLHPSVFLRGRLDTVVVVEEATSTLRFAIEGPRRDMSRKGSRIRADADQRLLAQGRSNDGSMRHISVAGRKTLYWGQRPSSGPASNGGATGSTQGRVVPRPGRPGMTWTV